jgi:mono/diheme cytochrome c family protein
MPTIPNFTSLSWQQSRSNPQLAVSILEGKNRLMPANRGVVSDSQAADLVAYVRRFGPARPSPVGSGTTSPGPAGTVPLLAGSTDFNVQFNRLVKEWDDLDRQLRELSSTPATENVPSEGSSKESIAKSGFAKLPILDRPLTAADVVRGRELFTGRRPLANGGPSCIACHAVHGGGTPEGGRLGPELTKVYERLGGRNALTAQLWGAATPTMLPVYHQHPLEPEEVVSLVAYLEEANREGVEEASPVPLPFLLLGLGGTVLGLVGVNVFWGTYFWPRSVATLNGSVGRTDLKSVPQAAGIATGTGSLPLGQGRGTQRPAATPAHQELTRFPEDLIAPGL